jgi:hypothetical protein
LAVAVGRERIVAVAIAIKGKEAGCRKQDAVAVEGSPITY